MVVIHCLLAYLLFYSSIAFRLFFTLAFYIRKIFHNVSSVFAYLEKKIKIFIAFIITS
jgi:hypothetical protein